MYDMKVSKRGVDFVKGWETFVPYVYDDKVPMHNGAYRRWKPGMSVLGTLTIGYGHTDAAKFRMGVKLAGYTGADWTEEYASNVLDVDLDDCEEGVNRDVTVELSQGQYDALVSLSFNLGPLKIKAGTLITRLNRGDYDGARQAFDLYVMSQGERMRGLQRRRDAEQIMWDTKTSTPAPVPVEPVDHPAEVDAVNPPSMITSKTGNTLIAAGTLEGLQTANTALAAVGETRQNAKDAGVFDLLTGLVSNPKFLLGVIVLMAIGAGWWFVRHKRQTEAS